MRAAFGIARSGRKRARSFQSSTARAGGLSFTSPGAENPVGLSGESWQDQCRRRGFRGIGPEATDSGFEAKPQEGPQMGAGYSPGNGAVRTGAVVEEEEFVDAPQGGEKGLQGLGCRGEAFPFGKGSLADERSGPVEQIPRLFPVADIGRRRRGGPVRFRVEDAGRDVHQKLLVDVADHVQQKKATEHWRPAPVRRMPRSRSRNASNSGDAAGGTHCPTAVMAAGTASFGMTSFSPKSRSVPAASLMARNRG